MDINIDITSLYDRMPDFENHEAARSWFKAQFDNRFLLRSTEMVEGKRVHYYHIVKNPENYQQYMESQASPVKHEITSMTPFESYTTVEISEDGDISISI